MKLTADQARELARSFRDISVALGDYRFQNWDSLTKAQRQSIENAEWTLLNYSSDFITLAVGLTLDNAQGSLKRIQEATGTAKKIVETIKTIKKIILIASSVIKLGAAIGTQNPGMIASAVSDVFTAATASA